MRAGLLILLIMTTLAFPKAWHAVKGANPRLFSKQLMAMDQPSINAAKILSQPFFYWGKGSQFYVYFSEDHLYVLKIPRASKMRESLIDRILRRKMKKPDLLKSLQIAKDYFSLETGLVAVHFGNAKDSLPFVLLYDRLHRGQMVDLNGVAFALQKRQTLLSSALVKAKEASESKQILMAYLDLISLEKKRGWMSHDCAFWLNFGFENGRVYRLDVGSYVPVDCLFSWRVITKPAFHWLKDNDPSLAIWFKQEIDRRERL
jgi:hypothetical protein